MKLLRQHRFLFEGKGSTLRDAQISARISNETRDLLDRQAKATGVRKGRLIETALRHHLRALQELPADALVPARIVLTRRSFAQVVERLRSPRKPAKALRDLMRHRPPRRRPA